MYFFQNIFQNAERTDGHGLGDAELNHLIAGYEDPVEQIMLQAALACRKGPVSGSHFDLLNKYERSETVLIQYSGQCNPIEVCHYADF